MTNSLFSRVMEKHKFLFFCCCSLFCFVFCIHPFPKEGLNYVEHAQAKESILDTLITCT